MTTESVISELEAFIAGKLGRQTVVDDAPEAGMAFHPQAVTFYNESPKSNFAGFADQAMFQTNLLLGEMDSDRKYRLERAGTYLLFTRYESSRGDGTFWATGQALDGAAGSDAERAFCQAAMEDVMRAASEPLRCAMEHMREAGLTLSAQDDKDLRTAIFGDA